MKAINAKLSTTTITKKTFLTLWKMHHLTKIQKFILKLSSYLWQVSLSHHKKWIKLNNICILWMKKTKKKKTKREKKNWNYNY